MPLDTQFIMAIVVCDEHLVSFAFEFWEVPLFLCHVG